MNRDAIGSFVVILAVGGATALGQTVPSADDHRNIQFQTVDFVKGTFTLVNFSSQALDLTGWRFCTHNYVSRRRYTGSSGLNGVTIPAGETLTVHVNNDAPVGDPAAINRSVLGGNFVSPFTPAPTALQLFRDGGGFGNSTLIADHIQWSDGSQPVNQTEDRTDQAELVLLWSEGDFIVTTPESLMIELTDSSGDIEGSSAEYAVTNPAAGCNAGDLAEPFGILNSSDVNAFVAAFLASEAPADLAEPTGIYNSSDVNAFVAAFLSGCP